MKGRGKMNKGKGARRVKATMKRTSPKTGMLRKKRK